jgi:hypothetical protein
MKIYFTPREVIQSRYNDDLLTRDPLLYLRSESKTAGAMIPCKLFKLKKVQIPKLAFDRMEEKEV